MAIKVGLCGFTIGAASYFDTYPVVEVQQTFYDPPAQRTLEQWRIQAPESFEFTMKAWQVITHRGTSRLRGIGSAYASYTDGELKQLHAWAGPHTYAMFNNIPRPRGR